MIYEKLPMAEIREIAQGKGISIEYHPHLAILRKGNWVISIPNADRKEMLRVIVEWEW